MTVTQGQFRREPPLALARQPHRLEHCSGMPRLQVQSTVRTYRTQDTANECINEWNNKPVFLSPCQLKKKKKHPWTWKTIRTSAGEVTLGFIMLSLSSSYSFLTLPHCVPPVCGHAPTVTINHSPFLSAGLTATSNLRWLSLCANKEGG